MNEAEKKAFYDAMITEEGAITWNDYWRMYDALRNVSKNKSELFIHQELCKRLDIPMASADLKIVLKGLDVKSEQYKIRFTMAVKTKLAKQKRGQAHSQKSPRSELSELNWEKISGFMTVREALQKFIDEHPDDKRLKKYGESYEIVFSFFKKVEGLKQGDPLANAHAIADLLLTAEGRQTCRAIAELNTTVFEPYNFRALNDELIKAAQWIPRYPLLLKDLEQSRDVTALKTKFDEISTYFKAAPPLSDTSRETAVATVRAASPYEQLKSLQNRFLASAMSDMLKQKGKIPVSGNVEKAIQELNALISAGHVEPLDFHDKYKGFLKILLENNVNGLNEMETQFIVALAMQNMELSEASKKDPVAIEKHIAHLEMASHVYRQNADLPRALERAREALTALKALPRLRIAEPNANPHDVILAVIVCTANKKSGQMEFEKVTDPQKIAALRASRKRLIEIRPHSIRYVPREKGGVKLNATLKLQLGQKIAEEVKRQKLDTQPVVGSFEGLKKIVQDALRSPAEQKTREPLSNRLSPKRSD